MPGSEEPIEFSTRAEQAMASEAPRRPLPASPIEAPKKPLPERPDSRQSSFRLDVAAVSEDDVRPEVEDMVEPFDASEALEDSVPQPLSPSAPQPKVVEQNGAEGAEEAGAEGLRAEGAESQGAEGQGPQGHEAESRGTEGQEAQDQATKSQEAEGQEAEGQEAEGQEAEGQEADSQGAEGQEAVDLLAEGLAAERIGAEDLIAGGLGAEKLGAEGLKAEGLGAEEVEIEGLEGEGRKVSDLMSGLEDLTKLGAERHGSLIDFEREELKSGGFGPAGGERLFAAESSPALEPSDGIAEGGLASPLASDGGDAPIIEAEEVEHQASEEASPSQVQTPKGGKKGSAPSTPRSRRTSGVSGLFKKLSLRGAEPAKESPDAQPSQPRSPDDLLRICDKEDLHEPEDVKMVQQILEDRKEFAKARDINGKLALHLLCEKNNGNQHTVEIGTLLLKAYKKAAKHLCPSQQRNKPGMLPLHMLCTQEHLNEFDSEMCRIVLHAYEEAAETPGGSGNKLPLSMIAERQLTPYCVPMFKRLLDAYKEAMKTKDNNGQILLHRLCDSSNMRKHNEFTVEIIRMLLDAHRRGPEAEDAQGRRPLHILAMSEVLNAYSLQLCGMLLENDEKLAGLPDNHGLLALHYLCTSETLSDHSQEICKKLLESFEKGAQAKDSNGRTPLHLVCRSRRMTKHSVDMARQLLLAFKQGYGVIDEKGQMPLHALCENMVEGRSGMEYVETVFDNLLWSDKGAITEPDGQGQLPIHLLCSAGFFAKQATSILDKLLKESTASAWGPDEDGYIPLHHLCMSKPHTEFTLEAFKTVTKVLADNGRNGASVESNTQTLAMHCLCHAGYHTTYSVQMFELLVSENAEAMVALDVNSKVPMHHLCGAEQHTDESEHIYDELVAALQNNHQDWASAAAEGGMLPLHILCAVGRHSESSYRMYVKLVESNREACQAKAISGRVAIHFLAESAFHSQSSLQICSHLLDIYPQGVTIKDTKELRPLHLLCTNESLTATSVEICKQVLDCFEKESSSVEAQEEEESDSELLPLLFVCESRTLTDHSVQICKLLLESYSRQETRRLGLQSMTSIRSGASSKKSSLPLHTLCSSIAQTQHSVEICKHLLTEHQDWAQSTNKDKYLPIHCLCMCEEHTEWSLSNCKQLLHKFANGAAVAGKNGMLPLHLLCMNLGHSEFSVEICEALLKANEEAAETATESGHLPLHYLCSLKNPTVHSVQICRLLIQANSDACSYKGIGDLDLPLHKLCKKEPHTIESVNMCELLVNADSDILAIDGNAFVAEDDEEEDSDISHPLMVLCRCEKLTRWSSDMCAQLVLDDRSNLKDPLALLNQKVYQPKGEEEQQKMAMRMMVTLAFMASEEVMEFLDLDESQNGPHSINFFKMIVDELGFDSANPLHHVLRAAQLFKTLSEHETASVLVNRLSAMSDAYLEWAAEMVESMPGKVAKKAIWSPEKESDDFMVGDSPIGIALELGDLKIVSHGAVFDVVKEAWPGKYHYSYYPFGGSINNNLFLEFDISGSKGKKSIKMTWPKRFFEAMNPNKLVASPMMMYALTVFLQTTFLVVFHIVVESGHSPNSYKWSLGPSEWYLVTHIAGGITFELGQMIGDGILRYSQDPWNVVDVSMYSLLLIWLSLRLNDSENALNAGEQFTPNDSISVDFLGLSAIPVWLRMLNVFGLDHNFGPLVRIIQGMVANVVVFLILLTIFLAGFATCLMLIFQRVQQTKGDFFEEEGIEFNFAAYENQAFSMLALLDMSLGNFDLVGLREVDITAFIVTVAFLSCTFIMLFNLLIALMTDTYAEIKEQSENLWKKDRAMLMAAYTKTEKMSNSFNAGGVLTALPQPMNLVVVIGMLLATPIYLPLRLYQVQKDKERKVTWEKIVNQQLDLIVKGILGVAFCFPIAMIFLVVILPLNWIFVAGAGLLDYLAVDLRGANPLKPVISRVLALLLLPFVYVYVLIVEPLRWIYKTYFRKKPKKAVTEEQSLTSFASFEAVGSNFGAYPETLDLHPLPSSANAIKEVGEPEHVEKAEKTNEAWEEDLDEDDMVSLRTIHRATMPIDNTEEDDPQDMPVNEADAALQEVRAELNKKLAGLEQNNRNLLQTIRELQIESKTTQQETGKALTDLDKKLTENDESTQQKILQLNQLQEENTSKLLELIEQRAKQAELLATMQSEQQSKTDAKMDLILASVYNMPAGGGGRTVVVGKPEAVETSASPRKEQEPIIARSQSDDPRESSSSKSSMRSAFATLEEKWNEQFNAVGTTLSILSQTLARQEADRSQQMSKFEDKLHSLSTSIQDLDKRLEHQEHLQKQSSGNMADTFKSITPLLESMEERITKKSHEENKELKQALEQHVLASLQVQQASISEMSQTQIKTLDQKLKESTATVQETTWSQIHELSEELRTEVRDLDDQVKEMVHKEGSHQTEQIESKIATVLQVLEEKIADSFQQHKTEQDQRLQAIQTSINRIPPPPAPAPQPPPEAGPKFTWSENLNRTTSRNRR